MAYLLVKNSDWSEGKGGQPSQREGTKARKSPQPHFKQTRKAERQLSTRVQGDLLDANPTLTKKIHGSFDAKAQGAGEVNSQGTLAVGVLGHARLGMVSRTMGLEWRELGYWNST